MNTADNILQYYGQLKPDWPIPSGFEWIFPFDREATKSCLQLFYRKYFSDQDNRRVLLGINPGRFGAGVTGIPFTDPKILENQCEIKNPFKKRNELSSIFVYEFIEAYGGIEIFYRDFWISSICPLGFLRNGINCNYYDDKSLYSAVEPYIVDQMKKQIAIGIDRSVAYSLGKGLNFKYLQKLNNEYKFFEKVVALPHPRWVMQYRRKSKDDFILKIVELLRD